MNLIHVSVSYEFLEFIPVWQNTKEKKIINKRLIITSSKILTNINLSLFHYENKNLRFPFLRAKEFSSTSISSLRRQKGGTIFFLSFFFTYPIITQKCIYPPFSQDPQLLPNKTEEGGGGREEISFRRSCSEEKSPWKIYRQV